MLYAYRFIYKYRCLKAKVIKANFLGEPKKKLQMSKFINTALKSDSDSESSDSDSDSESSDSDSELEK